jgi:RNA polymerase sigma-70 factor (ECF subfamily)
VVDESDDNLLEAWRAGEAAAGELLFERYFPVVCRFFANKDPASLDDLVQDTFLALAQGRQRDRGPRNFRAYLFGVAHNVLRASIRQRLGDSTVDDPTLRELQPSATTLLTRRADHRLLLEALRRIPSTQQVVLEFVFWEGMTGPEIAVALDLPLGTVRTRLRDGRVRLRRELDSLAEAERLVTTHTNLEQWAASVRAEVLDRLDRASAIDGD